MVFIHTYQSFFSGGDTGPSGSTEVNAGRQVVETSQEAMKVFEYFPVLPESFASS